AKRRPRSRRQRVRWRRLRGPAVGRRRGRSPAPASNGYETRGVIAARLRRAAMTPRTRVFDTHFLELRERQHVSWLILAAELPVERVHESVAGDHYRQLARRQP